MNKFYFRRIHLALLSLATLIVVFVFVLPAADTSSSLPAPPVARKEPKITEINGQKLVDNYFWLRDKKNPDVKAYLDAENVYTDTVMKPTEPLQKKLYDEMLSRVKETDIEVPYKEGGYFYYVRTEAGKQYGIRCRKKGSLNAPEEILIDVNELAKGQKFMSLGAYNVSDDGNLLAYSTDNTGFRQYTLAVKDLRTGKTLVDHAERVDSIAWANDNKTLFYTVEDPVAKRPYQLYRHAVGTAGPDTLIYEEKDVRFEMGTGKTRSKAYILLIVSSHTASEARYIPADQPQAEWKIIEPRKQDVEYYPDHNGNFFYIRVNDAGRNFRLVKAPVSDPRSKNWQEVVAHRPDVMLEDTDFFKNYYISYEREKGLPHIRVTDLVQTGKSRRVDFPEPAYADYPYVNREYDTTKFRYGYQSFITPQSVFEYDMSSGTSTLLKQKEVPGGYDRNRYQVERIFATASDGVKVPISVVHLKGAKLDGKGPIYLTGYGSYGYSYDIYFDSPIFSMVDRGVVVAVAHIRGGGEMGKTWHDDGRMMHKKNSFTDFIASAEYLLHHARRIHSPHRDGIRGVGQSQGKARVRLHDHLFALRQHRAEGLSQYAGPNFFQRQPGRLLGAREVRRQNARSTHRPQHVDSENQHGPCRSWRRIGALRQAP